MSGNARGSGRWATGGADAAKHGKGNAEMPDLRSRRGSFTVFVVMAFAAMLIALYAFIDAAGEVMVQSTAGHFGRLWGASILAEYDLNLASRYGLYAFYAGDGMTVEKLDDYARYTFDRKRYIDYGGAVCHLDDWRLSDPDILKKQMAEAVLFHNRPHPLRHSASAGGTAFGMRSITSPWILRSLPSAGDRSQSLIGALAEAIKSGQGVGSLLSDALTDRYLFTYFRHQMTSEEEGADFGDTYFRNEIEYILTGQPDDGKALKKVKNHLIALRNLLNLFYLYGCPEKRDAAMALATALTPGPEAVLTQAVLLEIWAYAESRNDAAMLLDGEPVPLLKRDENWALSLENVAGGGDAPDLSGGGTDEERDGYVRPPVIEGQRYSLYLQLLLCGLSERTKVLRAMDLIQINMKYLYCDYFLLDDYYTGLDFTMRVNGVEHTFRESYERNQ